MLYEFEFYGITEGGICIKKYWLFIHSLFLYLLQND